MKSISAILLISLSLASTTVYSNDFGQLQKFDESVESLDSKKEVKWQDVKYFKSFGPRWALGYSENKRMIAIYDLSYPALDTVLPFANWNPPQETFSLTKNLFLNSVPSDDLTASSIDKISQESSGWEQSLYPSDWWKTIVWKNASIARQANAPSTFSLADIDFSENFKMSSSTYQKQEFENRFEQLQKEWVVWARENNFSRDLLTSFLFKKGEDGKYQIYFVGSSQKKNSVPSLPKKIADLKFTPSGFLESLKIKIIQGAIGGLVDLIPVPIVANILSASVGRFFHFYKIMRVSQQVMALEFVNDLTFKDGIYPHNVFNSDDHELAAEALQFSQASLWDSFKWIWQSPYEQWQKDLQNEIDTAADSTKRLAEIGIAFEKLSEFYATTQKNNFLSVYSLTKNSRTKDPLLATDGEYPNNVPVRRITLEVVSATLEFGLKFLPIPFVGSIVKYFFNKYVATPADDDRAWEARLLSHLEQRQVVFKEDWSGPIQQIYNQRINPLMPSQEKTIEIIAKRKKAYSIE